MTTPEKLAGLAQLAASFNGVSIELQARNGAIHVHGLLEQPISVQFLTQGEAEEQLRRAVTILVADLRPRAIASRDGE